MTKRDWIVVRGGGDLASGIIHRLASAGFQVLVLETEAPAAIRRQVSFCEAIFEGNAIVEGKEAVCIKSLSEADKIIASGRIPIMADPLGLMIAEVKPAVVIDAIMAKCNLGTNKAMAPYTIAIGPGFSAGIDVDAVVETSRGHNLGRIILQGSAKPDTGVPGNIGGYTAERVIHAEYAGTIHDVCHISDVVKRGQKIAYIEADGVQYPVLATIPGIIRGLIRDGYEVTEGFKIADIDPREEELVNCFTISEKARCIAGSVLELVCALLA